MNYVESLVIGLACMGIVVGLAALSQVVVRGAVHVALTVYQLTKKGKENDKKS